MKTRWIVAASVLAVGCGGSDARVSASDDGGVASDAPDDGGQSFDGNGDSATAADARVDDASMPTPPDGGVTWWRPGAGSLPWQWELDHEIQTSSAADMATGATAYSGMPAKEPVVFDIDGFNNTDADVAALHARGKKVICYVEVGGAEQYRPDYASFPASALGKTVPSYPTEKYLDIRNASVLTIMKARIAMCAAKGFDAIEPDLDDTYGFDTGFPLTIADETTYLTTLSDFAHQKGLAWGLKNGGDGGDPAAFVAAMLPHVEFAVVEEPFHLGTIGTFEPAFSKAGKALFVAEYTSNTASAATFCPQALAMHTNAALFDVALDAKTRTPCE